MQAIILAAGKSTRTFPLTENYPKCLLKVANKTILEHNLEQLGGLVDEIILVVGYKKESVKKFLKDNKIKNIKIVEQDAQLGTAHALMQCQKNIKGRFVLLMGDDLYAKEDIKKCLRNKYSILAKKVSDYKQFGMLRTKGNVLKEIAEKPQKKISDLANTGLYVLDKSIFKIKTKKSSRKEYEITDMINALARKEKVVVEKVKEYWLPLSYPWNLLDANEFFLKKITKKEIKGEIEKYVTIKGNVVIGKNTKIKSFVYIEGPVVIGENCEIGPFTYIRPYTSIGNNCRIGRCEIYDAILLDNVTSKHSSYIAHSVVGERVNMGAGFISADYRHDGKSHMTVVNRKKVDTGRRKLGAFLGDDVKTAIGTLVYPGRKIAAGKTTLPGEVVKEDVF